MAYLYERSSTWRKIVAFTRRSPLYMAAFAGVCIGGPMLLGNSVMNKTNPEHETDLERQLRAKGSYHAQALAQAQRERLQVMFDELKSGGGDQRYAAALDGKSLGTHSTGTTKGAVSIQQQQQQQQQHQRQQHQQHADGAPDSG